MILAGSMNQRISSKRRHPVDLHCSGIFQRYFFHQHIKIAVTGEQYHNIHSFCRLKCINGNTNIPVSLGRTISTLDKGLQFHPETDMLKGFLKP